MLSRFKWLCALICFFVQYILLPSTRSVGLYPELTLCCVCVLGLIYGADVGMFYGAVCGIAAMTLYTSATARIVVIYSLCGLVCGLMHGRARASRVLLPVASVGILSFIRQIADIAVLGFARAYIYVGPTAQRAFLISILTALCALPIYFLFYKSEYGYRVIGKRVGR